MSGEITRALNSMAAEAASVTALRKQNRQLTRENKRLERELGKARRITDDMVERAAREWELDFQSYDADFRRDALADARRALTAAFERTS